MSPIPRIGSCLCDFLVLFGRGWKVQVESSSSEEHLIQFHIEQSTMAVKAAMQLQAPLEGGGCRRAQ